METEAYSQDGPLGSSSRMPSKKLLMKKAVLSFTCLEQIRSFQLFSLGAINALWQQRELAESKQYTSG